MKIKNLKISSESHEVLKKYCMKKGYKIHNSQATQSAHTQMTQHALTDADVLLRVWQFYLINLDLRDPLE